MNMFSNIGKKIGPFYFTVGGIGDLLLTLAGFYQIDMSPVSLVMWANDRDIIKQILNKKHFPLLKHTIITDNFVGSPQSLDHYRAITDDPMFMGKFHIPDNLQYVSEWMRVKQVFQDFRISQNNLVLRSIFYDDRLSSEQHIVIHPYSLGRDGLLKGKIIQQENLIKVLQDIQRDFPSCKIVCIGTQEEQAVFQNFVNTHMSISYESKLIFPQGILESMTYVASAFRVYSADTWTKTMAGLCSIPTTVFTCSADMSKLFPQTGYDPSDNIFIKGWGFDIVQQSEKY